MADNRFKHFQFEDFRPRQHPNCAACEELMTDAVDGLLSPADEAFFDLHLPGCVDCTERYAQAQRGAAWLDLLKTQQPQPSAALLERILAQTVGQTPGQHAEQILAQPAFDEVPMGVPVMPVNVLPFLPRPASRFTRMTRLAMEPRLAMTAAMAFFSIALTMNLTGIRFDQIHAADLKPANLKRTYYEANASAVRYYDNLRVVRVLESRVDDLRQSNEADRPSHASPESRPDTVPADSQPDSQPDQKPRQKKQDTPAGSSRRESPLPEPSLLRTSFTASPDKLRRDASAAATLPSFKKEGGLV